MRRTLLSLLASLTSALPASALRGDEIAGSEVRTAPEATDATIPDRITDGTPPLPPPPVVKPDFQIESTQVKRVDVVEAPEMPDLPPVEGRITIKVHTVADPGLPDPPPPLPPLEVNDPQVLARLAELRAKYKETKIVFLSATVYDDKRTWLRCYPSGDVGKEIAAWSNIDFNHFCGFGGLEATGADGEVRKYSLRVTLIEDLHALYRSEGVRMAEACAAREKAHEERKAYLLANPEKPKDVKVHFWKREKSAANTQAKGEQP